MTEQQKPTLLIIDGHSLAFRAFFALPTANFSTKDGQYTNAIHGFISMFLLLLQNENPSHIVVAFDKSRKSFRTREYEEYKATRSETPHEFKGQIGLLQEALKLMGVTTIEVDDFEADDILATLATTAEQAGYQILLVSGDRDTIQLITDNVTLLYPSALGVSQLKRYDEAAVLERYGVKPEQYPDVAALVGESSDNLIGIDKVGEKTAVKWVQKYGSLDGVLNHLDEIGGVVGQNLREQQDRAIRNRRLNKLVRSVPLDLTIGDFARKPIDLDQLRPFFERLEFRTLFDRLVKGFGGATTGDQGSLSVAGIVTTEVRAPEPSRLSTNELVSWLVAQEDEQPVALAVESIAGRVVALGLAVAGECVQSDWSVGDPIDSWLLSNAPKIVADAKIQYKTFRNSGLELGGALHDPLIAAGLVNPSQVTRNFGELVSHYLGQTVPDPDPNQLIPVESSVLQNGVLAWYAHRLNEILRSELHDTELLDQVEIPLIPVLARMELNGILIDRIELAKLNSELGLQVATIADNAFAVIGREINLASPKQLQDVLFDELKMPKTRRTKTGYTTDAGALADLMDSHPHPFLDLLMQHRDASKLRQMVESLERSTDDIGRIHTTYGQVGTATGRISSTDPNLQNIPIRTEEGRRIRAAFRGRNGDELLTADYSQIEMRIMAHLSNDPGLIEAFHSGEDLHRFVGSRIFAVEPENVTAQMRNKVKAMSYGLAYGLSAFGLSKQLRIDQADARALMTGYFERFGSVRDYLRGVVEQARIDGYTETIMGRRRPFPDLNSPNRQHRENAERAALNSPIQGSAADIIKVAMIRIDGDMRGQQLASRMLLQVHDELVFEVAAGEFDRLAKIVSERMSTAVTLSVPLEVQIGRGSNWDIAAH